MTEVNDLVTASLHLSKLGMIESGQATSYLTSMLKGFKLEASDAMSVVDKLTKVDMAAATSAGDIAESLRQFAVSAQMSGVDIDQAIAMATTIMDVSQRDASSVGNALKTMIARYGNVKAGKYSAMTTDGDEGDTGEALNDIEKVLSKVGIRMRETNLEFRDFDDILEELADKWSTIDDVSRNAIATALAGTRQRESLLVLLENMDKYHELIEVSKRSAGTAEEKYLSYSEQLEASQKRIAAAWEELAGNADINRFLTDINKIIEGVMEILPLLLRVGRSMAVSFVPFQIPQIVSFVGNKLGIGDKLSSIVNKRKKTREEKELFTGKWLEGHTLGDEISKTLNIPYRKGKGLVPQNIDLSRNDFDLEQAVWDSYRSRIARNEKWVKYDKDYDKWKKAQEKFELTGIVPEGYSDAAPEAPEDYPKWDYNAESLLFRRGLYGKDEILKVKKQELKVEKQITAETKKQEENKESGTEAVKEQTTESAKQTVEEQKQTVEETKQTTEEQKQTTESAKQGTTKAARDSLKSLEEKQEEARKEAKASLGKFSKLKKRFADKKAVGLTGVEIGLSALMSGLTVSGEHTAYGETVQSSDAARKGAGWASAGITAGAGVAGALIAGPLGAKIGSMAGSVIGELISPFISRWIDADRDARNQRVKIAEKNLAALNSISSNTKVLSEYASKESQTYEEYQEMAEGLDSLKEVFIQNAEMATKIFTILKQTLGDKLPDDITNIVQLLNYYADADAETKQMIANTMEATMAREKATEKVAAAENKQYELNKKISKFSLGGKTYKTGESEYNATTGLYEYVGPEEFYDEAMQIIYSNLVDKGIISSFDEIRTTQKGPHTRNLSLKNSKLSTKRQAEVWKEVLKELENQGQTNTETYARLKKMLSEYESAQTELMLMYNEANEAIGQEALYTAKSGDKYLSEMNEAQLKRLGKDKIYDILAKQIEASGGLYGYAIDSDEGRAIIEKIIKSNEKLYGLWTGQAYTLSEALQLQDVEVLEQFSQALGVTIDSLDELEERFGTVKLGDILGGVTDIRSSFEEYTNLFQSLASSSGLTAENLEKIINTYPDLIPYLSDETELAGQLLQRVSAYQDLYAKGIFEDMMSKESLFSDFTGKLTEETQKALEEKFGGAKKMTDILPVLLASPEEAEALGLTKDQLEEIVALYEKMYTFDIEDIYQTTILESMSQYQQKILEKQINNLEEQKQALQDINKQREYENKLVEARLKLEDAQKQKKRVWRAGVGWVYETDTEKVKEAQENLEEVKNQKAIDELQREIDELTSQKEILGGITDKKELEKLNSTFEAWLEQTNNMTDSQEALIQKITAYYNDLGIRVGGKEYTEGIANTKEQAFEDVFGSKETSYWSKLKYWEGEMGKYTDHSSQEYKDAEKAYNEALRTYKEKAASFRDAYDSQRIMGTEEQKSYLEKDKSVDDSWINVGDIEGKKYKVSPQNTYPDTTWFQPKSRQYKTWFWTPDKKEKTRETGDRVNWKTVEEGYGNWITWVNYQPEGTIVRREKDKSKYGIILKDAANGTGIYPLEAAAMGSLGLSGGPSIVNEMGTEAIVTPSGTITSLPSSTGVVPADITKNLWALGEVAPSLARMIMADPDLTTYVGGRNSTTDESFNVGTINMTVNADDSFDVDAFVDQIKTKAALSRRSKR